MERALSIARQLTEMRTDLEVIHSQGIILADVTAEGSMEVDEAYVYATYLLNSLIHNFREEFIQNTEELFELLKKEVVRNNERIKDF